MDRGRDKKRWGNRRTGKGKQKDRDTDIHGQGHRRTGTGTQTDRDRETDGQGEGHRRTGTGTQSDRDKDTDGQGQGHRRTGTETGRDRGRNYGLLPLEARLQAQVVKVAEPPGAQLVVDIDILGQDPNPTMGGGCVSVRDSLEIKFLFTKDRNCLGNKLLLKTLSMLCIQCKIWKNYKRRTGI
jgi:hypothetical protein